MDLIKTANRCVVGARWISAILIVIAVILLARSLPVGRGLEWIEGWIDGLGVWGPVVFAAVYVVSTVALVPGSPLTLAAGAFFGPAWGTAAVSIGSTMSAAVAFLIGRYAARNRIAQLAGRNPRFKAIDSAISRGGWRIVALLRLVPLVPFSLSNYAFGLTAVRFGPYVLASWLCMLPGTFLYVYIGYLGSRGFTAASGGGVPSIGKWTAYAIGLLAAVAVTFYLTKLARAALAEHLDTPREDEPVQQPHTEVARPRRWTWGTTFTALVAVGLLGTASCAYVNRDALGALLGPPRVELRETYAQQSAGPVFDHSPLDALLKKHVGPQGRVAYDALDRDSDDLQRYLDAVARAPFDQMGRNQKLALLINSYNAFTLRLILDYLDNGRLESIKDIPASKRWKARRWVVGGHTWSLDEIEQEQIRPHFREPRIHFALVCAAVGCPPLRNEAYRATSLEEQLEDQARYVHDRNRWFRYDESAGVVHLTQLYDWYGSDFEQVAGSALAYAARYSPALKLALDQGREPSIRWLKYDWQLNKKPKGE